MLEFDDRERGLLMNLTGDGKGKSTSAFGTALRALGWGWRVAVIQFMKGERPTGEKNFFSRYFSEMIFEQYGLGLTTRPGDHRGMAQRGWARTRELLESFDGELLILDELNVALHHGFLDPAEIAAALLARRATLNLIVTGRHEPPELVEIADLVSEIADIKHPFHRGIPTRKGVDY